MLPLLAFAVLMNSALVEVPASRWSAVDLPVAQHDTVVDGDFEVIRGSKVQIVIADREQAERLHRGRSFHPVFTSGFAAEGRIRVTLREAGDYVLLVDNRIEGRGSATVRLNLSTSNRINIQARELPPARRRAVIALSLLFFGSVVVFSAWQFLRHAPG
jgi:hypothetical protein